MSKNFNVRDVVSGKDEWLTPCWVLNMLGQFSLDPCSPVTRPWSTASRHYTIMDDGLSRTWDGRVWLNPPYGNETLKWMRRMKEHNHGTALIFARTETRTWHECVFRHATGLLFLKGRLRFCNVDGTLGPTSAVAPSCLIAYGNADAEILKGLDSEKVGRFTTA